MKKTVVVLLVVIAIFFSSTLYLLYLNFNRSQTTPIIARPIVVRPTATPVPDLTTGWKTYIDSKNNFTFEYPANWEVKADNSGIFVGTSEFRTDLPEGGMGLSIAPSSLSLNDFLHQYNSKEYVHPTSTDPNHFTTYSFLNKQENIIFAGIPATRMVVTTEEGIDVTYIYLNHNNQNWVIDYFNGDPIHRQILSTFKFNNSPANNLQVQIENWSKYKPAGHNFSWDKCGPEDSMASINIKDSLSTVPINFLQINHANFAYSPTSDFTSTDLNQFILCEVGNYTPLHLFADKILWYMPNCGGVDSAETTRCQQTIDQAKQLYPKI